MKKIKQIILTLLVVSFLVNPMYLTLRVHAANEEIAMSRVSDTLQNVMEISSEEETIEVMIWLEDINNLCDIANLDLYLYDVNYELVASSISTNSNVEILRDVPIYDDDYWLVIVQAEPASYNGSNMITNYSLTWCYK